MLIINMKSIAVVIMFALLMGCADDKPTLKVGSKPFSESAILAEMIAQLAENEGINVERNMSYGTTARVMEATKQGVIDIYPEYNGTSLIFLGQAPTSDSAQSTTTVNTLFKDQGLELANGFGFSNDYVMAMTPERAQELGVTKISDLAKLDVPITFTIDEDFLERPADGLQQMSRRYGITGSSHIAFPIGAEGKDQQISALLDQSADVAELYATDGQIAEYGLVVLEDDQQFFPIYESMPLVRSDALANVDGLAEVLKKLEGAITSEDMQAMNKAVDLDAQTAASVATNFLVSKGMLPEGAEVAGIDEIKVAADPGVGRSSTTAKALRAIRAGFSGSDLEVTNHESPLMALENGSARVAMVGAESFYSLGEAGPEANQMAEAFAVLGYKTAHLIGLKTGPKSITEMKNIVTDQEGTGSAIVLTMLLNSFDLTNSVNVTYSDSSLEQLVGSVVSGEHNAVFVMEEENDRAIARSLVNPAVNLVSLEEWAQGGHTARFSFIRPATIPAKTYKDQFRPVSTVSTQYVLAGPVEKKQDTGEVGPGTAGTLLDGGAVPISAEAVASIREAIGDTDVIDPSMPVHASLAPEIEVVSKALPFSANVSIMNILLILFSVWIIYLCFLPSPRSFTMPEGDD